MFPDQPYVLHYKPYGTVVCPMILVVITHWDGSCLLTKYYTLFLRGVNVHKITICVVKWKYGTPHNIMSPTKINSVIYFIPYSYLCGNNDTSTFKLSITIYMYIKLWTITIEMLSWELSLNIVFSIILTCFRFGQEELTKLTSCYFQKFITRVLLIKMLR